jgi:regulator of nucleoside diphosphate kinase
MTTLSLVDFNLSPDIVLGAAEYRQLSALALTGTDAPEDADWLLHELERALIVPDDTVPDDVVRMNSTVLFRMLDGDEHSVQLVFPRDANITARRVSVLTPVGAALIGLRAGQSITVITRDGRKQVLTVLSVKQPEPEPESCGDDKVFPPPAA